jgi:hypothetical protein
MSHHKKSQQDDGENTPVIETRDQEREQSAVSAATSAVEKQAEAKQKASDQRLHEIQEANSAKTVTPEELEAMDPGPRTPMDYPIRVEGNRAFVRNEEGKEIEVKKEAAANALELCRNFDIGTVKIVAADLARREAVA